MFCPRCGSKLADGECNRCGLNTKDEQAVMDAISGNHFCGSCGKETGERHLVCSRCREKKFDAIEAFKEILQGRESGFKKVFAEKPWKLLIGVYLGLMILMLAFNLSTTLLPLIQNPQLSKFYMGAIIIYALAYPIITLIIFLVYGFVMHLICRLLKGDGSLKDTFLAYLTASDASGTLYLVFTIFGSAVSIIPCLGCMLTPLIILLLLGITLYVIYLNTLALSIIHRLSRLKAAVAVIAPIIISIIISLILGFLFFASIMSQLNPQMLTS
ncbi:MAG: hypothetical protein GF334_04130 [Candidatus Altiarchaeales archaeon]|nr:hypothetical protein [Candidatus Altiarchaeales archaeon]